MLRGGGKLDIEIAMFNKLLDCHSLRIPCVLQQASVFMFRYLAVDTA